MSKSIMEPLKLRIDWSELDTFHHVNNVAYFKYLQAARVRLCEFIGLAGDSISEGLAFMVAASKCDFKRPLSYPGYVTIESKVVHIGVTSFRLVHNIFDDSGTLVAIGEDALVVFDFQNESKVSIDLEAKEKLKQLMK